MELLQLQYNERVPLEKDIIVVGYALIEDNKLSSFDVEQYFLTEMEHYRDIVNDLIYRTNDIKTYSLPISLRAENDIMNSNIVSEVPFIALTFPQYSNMPGIILQKPFFLKRGTNLTWKANTKEEFFNNFKFVIYYSDAEGKKVNKFNELAILEAGYYTKRYNELDSMRLITQTFKFNYSSVFVRNIRLLPTIVFDITNTRVVYGFDCKVSLSKGNTYKRMLTDNEYINLYFTGYYLYADIDMFNIDYKSGDITKINEVFGSNLPLGVSIQVERENISYNPLISPTVIVEYTTGLRMV